MSSCATCGRGKKHFGLIDLPSEIKFLWRVASNACISTYLLRTHFGYCYQLPNIFTPSSTVRFYRLTLCEAGLQRHTISQSYTKSVNDEGFTLLMLLFSN